MASPVITSYSIHYTKLYDTEVILQGYRTWGRDIVRRLDGIYAFAIWDAGERKVFAARDRLGVKPLFYSVHNGLVIASVITSYSIHYTKLYDSRRGRSSATTPRSSER